MPQLTVIAFALGSLCLFFHLAFLGSLLLRRMDFADTVWGLGFIVVALATAYGANSVAGIVPTRLGIVVLLTILWATRLASHIFLRNQKRGEDERYIKLLKEWRRFPWLGVYLKVFLLQGFFLAIIAAPIYFTATPENPQLGAWDLLGILFWACGFSCEAVSDYQLTKFKRNPANRGKIITSGLWSYSRHPNYFGEVLLWWGIFLIACATPQGWKSFFGPLTLTLLILKVSGVTMLESHMESRPDFADYKRRVSAFIPWFPKK